MTQLLNQNIVIVFKSQFQKHIEIRAQIFDSNLTKVGTEKAIQTKLKAY